MVVSTARAHGVVRAVLGEVVSESGFESSVRKFESCGTMTLPSRVFLGRALEDGAQVAGDATVVECLADNGPVETRHGAQAA